MIPEVGKRRQKVLGIPFRLESWLMSVPSRDERDSSPRHSANNRVLSKNPAKFKNDAKGGAG